MGELDELVICQRLHPPEPCIWSESVHIDTIKEQHVNVDVEIQRTAESLDQRHRTCVGGFLRSHNSHLSHQSSVPARPHFFGNKS